MPRLALALAVLLAAPVPAQAERLLVRARDAAALERGAIPGIARIQPLRLDAHALADLRAQQAVVIEGFPLGRARTATLELTRFSPFSPNARVEVMEDAGPRELALPDAAYFRGAVAGEPDSRVLLIAGPDEVHGFVASAGDVFPFGRGAGGAHRTYALRDANPAFFPPPGDFCRNDLHPDQVRAPVAAPAALAMPAVAALVQKQAEIAIDTDQELRAKFASDQETLDYLASLLAAASAIYERDVSVQLLFSYIRLWNTTDPWSASDTSGALSELFTHWNSTMLSFPRDLVHMISGKPIQGGIAYVDVLCNAYWAYGVSQVNGAFDLAVPSQIWDVVVLTHELGHEFGSSHTHCYSPPVDMCFNLESGCYAGAAVPSQGTIMSYCHLHPGGLANIDLVFGGVVSARIGASVAAAACLDPVTTTSTSVTTTTSTSVTTTTSTSVTSTTSTSATSTTSTSVTTTTSTSATTTSLPTTTTSSTTSTTAPDAGGPEGGGEDEDGDGVPDAADRCAGSPPGDLLDADGCSECPCTGPAGAGWGAHHAYQRCVRDAVKRRLAARAMSPSDKRAAMQHARQATCGRAGRTRCCTDAGDCRVVTPVVCGERGGVDLGPGSCRPSPCE